LYRSSHKFPTSLRNQSRHRSTPGADSRDKFRPDIQGLRAIAVLLVALSHAHVAHLAGGFVGVDVFFVISGYLITGWLLHRTQRRGKLPMKKFYAARARRILPAAALTLAATVIASRYLLNYVRAQSAFHDAIWSAFFAANIHFSAVGTNYFSQGQPASPLQHFWSLAVEEQFYLVWPALLLVALFLLRRHPLSRKHRPGGGKKLTFTHRGVDGNSMRRVEIILVVCVVSSLAWSIYYTSANPTASYFSTLARAWELGVGALIAVTADRLARVGERARAIMSWVGLCAIGASAVLFTAGTAFPGYAALLPVLGAGLVVIGGVGGNAAAGASMVLGRQPLCFIGDVSYSFYLWHWPVLIIAEQYVGHSLPVLTNLALLAGAFALSTVTYLFFENPIRRGKAFSVSWRALLLWPASIGTVVFATVLGFNSINAELQAQAAANSTTTTTATTAPPHGGGPHSGPTPAENAVIESVTSARLATAVPFSLSPTVANLTHDEYSMNGCSAGFGTGTSGPICHLGDTTANRTVVVFGDSHSQMWMPAFLYFASTEHWRLIPIVKEGCTASAFSGGPEKKSGGDCQAWFNWALGQVSQIKPSAVILSTAYSKAGETTVAAASDGLRNEINDLTKLTPHLLVMQDTPYLSQQPVDCLLARGATLGSCTLQLPASLVSFNTTLALIVKGEGTLIPTLQWFCAKGKCPTVIGSTIGYIDQGHISETYAKQLEVPLAAELQAALAK
jgi:peptidoglycan/LPS O-acetylase OafA/YrhL